MKKRPCTAAIIGAVIVAAGCSRDAEQTAAAASPPAPPAVTKPVFDPVYRAAKGVQGAVQSGVTHVKYGELLQALSTEINIARDQQLNTTDQKLIALFEESYGHFRNAGALWTMKNEASDEMWKGEIPVEFKGQMDPAHARLIEIYQLPLTNRRVQYTGTRYRAIPGDSMQLAWARADVSLQAATDLYYGR